MSRILFILLFLYGSAFGQKTPFERYGPPGSEVYKDFKFALKSGKSVFKLDLSYQSIEQKQFNKISKLTNLQALQLSSNGLNNWPEDFNKLYNLVFLASFNNSFPSFPKGLKKLESLMYLEIFNSKIDSIPDDIAYLQRLRTLKLGGNEDSIKISRKIKLLKNLNELVVESTILDSCPSRLFKISSLKYLALIHSAVQALPEDLSLLTELEVLKLDQNKLSRLPRSIYKCKKLIALNLKDNQITKIPDTICQLTSLTQLDLRGNPISKEDIEELKILLPGCKILF